MATLPSKFQTAKTLVEPNDEDKKHAADAHAEVREVLEADETLKSYAIDTVLIGSYKRHVSIRRVKDVDVLSKLPDLDDSVESDELLDHIEDVLSTVYDSDDAEPKRIERQDASIKVLFPDWDLHVDVVPARPDGDYLEIPARDGGWQQTNPEKLTELTSDMNGRYDDDYVPVVKLIRQTRRTHLGKRPGGLYFEIMAYHAFDDGLDDSSTAALFTTCLRSIATQLDELVDGAELADPTRPGENIATRVTEQQLANAATTFTDLAVKAEDALEDDDDCAAALRYREILGKNADDDWVFEMPADCDEDGNDRAFTPLFAGDRQVPAGDGRFA